MESGFIISLAHFCETHGPTSILCTQLAPISCHTCHPLSTPPSECTSNPSSYVHGFWESSSPPSSGPQLFSPFASPPTSPRPTHASYNPYFAPPSLADQRGRNGRRSSEQNDGSCDSCSYLVPKNMTDRLPAGAPGSPAKDGKGRNGSPVLRTTQKVLVRGHATPSLENASTPPSSQTSPQNSYEERDVFAQKGGDRRHQISSTLSSSTNSDYSSRSRNGTKGTHAHNLTYVSLRQPSSPTVYSLLRRAVLRTLSCESLPRGSSAGSMMFGDNMSGYTIAYLFRLPDPRARGSWRKYALLCLGPRDSWRVSSAMVQITQTFEKIAAGIVAMADRVLAKEVYGLSNAPAFAPASPLDPNPTIRHHTSATQKASSPTDKSIAQAKVPTDVSSFLRAKRVDSDGHPLSKREAMEAKSLCELVGRDDFFIELHTSFCKILSGLVGGYRPA